MEQVEADQSVHEPMADETVSSSLPAADDTADISRQNQPHRWIRITVATIKSLLLLELANLMLGPLARAGSSRRQKAAVEEDSDSDLDPADVLMDYLTGKTGLAAVQMLRNDQLQAAVDNLITDDFEELGVSDRGAEIRKIVEEIIEAREKGVPATPIERQKRVGLGKVGPLRFRSTKQSLARAVAADSEAPEQDAKSAGEAGQAAASPPAAAAGDAGDAQSQ